MDAVDKDKKEVMIPWYGEIEKRIATDAFARKRSELDKDTAVANRRNDGTVRNDFSGLGIVVAIHRLRTLAKLYRGGAAGGTAAGYAVWAAMEDHVRMKIRNPYVAGALQGAMSANERKAMYRISAIGKSILKESYEKPNIAARMQKERGFLPKKPTTKDLRMVLLQANGHIHKKILFIHAILSQIIYEYKPHHMTKMDLIKIAAMLGLTLASPDQQMSNAAQKQQLSLESKSALIVDRFMKLGETKGVLTDTNNRLTKRRAHADFDLFAHMFTKTGSPRPAAKGSNRPRQAGTTLRSSVGLGAAIGRADQKGVIALLEDKA